MKRVFLAVVFLGLVLRTSESSAITAGQLDGSGHPNAGAFVWYDPNLIEAYSQENGPGPFFICSAVLVHERVTLTAGHCINEVQPADARVLFVTFNPDDAFAISDYRPVAMYGGLYSLVDYYNQHGKLTANFLNETDLGTIVLANAVTDIAPAVLPSPNFMTSSSKNELRASQYEAVGYGNLGGFRKDPLWGVIDGQRRVTTSMQFLNVLDNFLLFQQNVSAGQSGVCDGDSGAPLFLVDATTGARTLIALTSQAPNFCRSVAQPFRLDIPESLDFIQGVIDGL